MADSAKMLL